MAITVTAKMISMFSGKPFEQEEDCFVLFCFCFLTRRRLLDGYKSGLDQYPQAESEDIFNFDLLMWWKTIFDDLGSFGYSYNY